MKITNDNSFNFNNKVKYDFDGGNLTSDAGLLLLKEFYHKLDLETILKECFQTTDPGHVRIHKDYKNLLQAIFQITLAYFQDCDAGALRNDPAMIAAVGKEKLASQPTMSRFYNRMDKITVEQLNNISCILRNKIYTIEHPEQVLFDLDTTLFATYGNQEGAAFNYHYQADGYHPLLCFDGLTGDLLKAELRPGAMYCCKGVADFMRPLIESFQAEHPDIPRFLRADSGFATNELYSLCETNGTAYVIRLKSNPVLKRLAGELDTELYKITKKDLLSPAVVYGEFLYQAGSWEYERRVICKIEKPEGQMIHLFTFLVTNMESSPEDMIRFYCKRGKMENFIKECKNGFDMDYASSSTEIVNENRMLIHALAYNLFNWFRRLVLPETMKKERVGVIRLKLMKIAAKIVCTSRYIFFKICSYYPYKEAFRQTMRNIHQLQICVN